MREITEKNIPISGLRTQTKKKKKTNRNPVEKRDNVNILNVGVAREGLEKGREKKLIKFDCVEIYGLEFGYISRQGVYIMQYFRKGCRVQRIPV